VDELRADSVVSCQLPTTGRGAWKAAQRAAGIAAQQELRPPQTGQRRLAGRPKHRKFGLRGGDRKYATQGGRGAITLVECCGGESRAWDKTVRVEVMTSGNSRMRWACGLSPARETGGAESGLQVGLRLCGCGRVLETLEIRKRSEPKGSFQSHNRHHTPASTRDSGFPQQVASQQSLPPLLRVPDRMPQPKTLHKFPAASSRDPRVARGLRKADSSKTAD
jgi:hypothetical protein